MNQIKDHQTISEYMEYGQKFYHTKGCTVLTEDNINGLIFDQKEEIKSIQNTCDQTPGVLMALKGLREELALLRDLKSRTPGKQLELF